MSNHESRYPWAIPRLVLAAATLLFAAACADEPVAPLDTHHPGTIEADAAPSFAVHLTCAVDIAAGSMECGPSAPSAAGNRPVGGPNMNLIVGGQHQFVRMGNDEPTAGAGVWSANVTVQNLTLQPMGTINGTDPTGYGVRVFFVDEPTNGVVVSNHDGEATFLGSESAKYYGYVGGALGEDEILAPGEVSEAMSWEFELNEATEFTFSVLIATEVPDTDGYAVGLTNVSAGSEHTCAQGDDDKLYCWGRNQYGQLGDGTTTDRHLPVVVAGSGGS